ncbi:MAG: lipopolysaccharide biosynthesis protein [Acidobacteriia bacterium]|nr:lipopolysaccharide biosynthesis protein [Terriglobia bacterium]
MTRREWVPADYLAMLRRRWVLITILAIMGPPLGYGVSRILPAKYKSQTLVLVQPPTVSAKIVEPVDASDISQRLSSMQQQILSRSRLEPIIRQLGLYAKDVDRVSMDGLVERLQKTIEVSPVQPMAETRTNNLPGFFIKVTTDSPQTAQQICSAVTSMFIEENLRTLQQRSEVTTQFLSDQLADAKKSLDAQDAALAAFKSRHLGSLPDQAQTNLNLLTGLTSQLDAATQALARAQQDKSFTESMLEQQISAWQSSQAGHDPETLEQQLTILQTQLSNLQARYTDNHPDVIKAKNDIAQLQKKIAESNAQHDVVTRDKTRSSVEPPQITQLRAQVHTHEQVIAEKSKEQEKIKEEIRLYQDRVQASPVVEEEYKQLTRGYQTALDSYNGLLKKRDDAAMATDLQRQQQGEQFRVLDPANLPDKPSFPDRRLFALGGLAGGLGLGLGLAFLLEMRDTSLRTERDVEYYLRLPLLVMIPAVKPLQARAGSPLEVVGGAKSSLKLGARV